MAFFITFEGIEGGGKTTQLRLLAEKLRSLGYTVAVTREPGGCAIADRIRDILLDAGNSAMKPTTELLLYAAARAQHVSEVIVPALGRGDIVLCDRYTDATVAYQGYGRMLDHAVIAELNRLAAGGVEPQITVLIDCPVEIGLTRAMSRINSCQGAREERFELESLQFHQRVRNGYLKLADEAKDRCIVIDGAGNIDATSAAVTAAVLPRLARD